MRVELTSRPQRYQVGPAAAVDQDRSLPCREVLRARHGRAFLCGGRDSSSRRRTARSFVLQNEHNTSPVPSSHATVGAPQRSQLTSRPFPDSSTKRGAALLRNQKYICCFV